MVNPFFAIGGYISLLNRCVERERTGEEMEEEILQERDPKFTYTERETDE